MPSFLYRLRDQYERTETEEQGTAGKTRRSPPPIHLTLPVDGLQHQPAVIAAPSSRPSRPRQPVLYGCCYVLCFIPCLLLSAIRGCYHSVRRPRVRWSDRSTLKLLACLLSALGTLLMLIALAQDRFARLHYDAPSLPSDATLGSFHYCSSPPTTSHPHSCHTIDRHCTAGGYALIALVGHRGESVTCERFNAFRTFFLLAFITSLFSPVTLALYILRPRRIHYAVAVGAAVVEALCVLLSMVFFLPLLPSSSSASPLSASSQLGSSFWLHFTAFIFAVVVAALTSYEERKRRQNEWSAETESRSDRDEAESIMAAAARRQGKPVADMAATTAGTAAAEQLEEGVVVSGMFALGSDVEHDLDLDHFADSTSSDGRLHGRTLETVDVVEREYAHTAVEHDGGNESDEAGRGGVRGKEAQVEMHTVGLSGVQPEQGSSEAEVRRKTASNRLP